MELRKRPDRPSRGAHNPRHNRTRTSSIDPHDPSRAWLPEIVQRIASFLPPNEVACTLRLVDRATAEQFKHNTSVKLSQPSPRQAFAVRWAGPDACRGLTLSQRRKLLCLTAASGDVANLAVAIEAAGVLPDEEVVWSAAVAGELEACQWLSQPGRLLARVNWRRVVLGGAAKEGHSDMCEWALGSTADSWSAWGGEAVEAAARGGHTELLFRLLEARPPGSIADHEIQDWFALEGFEVARPPPWAEKDLWWGDVLKASVASCDLATVEQLCRQHALVFNDDGFAPLFKSDLLPEAIGSPTVDWMAKAEWLQSKGGKLSFCTSDTAYRAAAQLPGGAWEERFAWLATQGQTADAKKAWQWALEAGNTAALRSLLSRGALRPSDDGAHVVRSCTPKLASAGELELLRTLHTAGFDLGPPWQMSLNACSGGQLEVMEWLRHVYGAGAIGVTSPSLMDAAAESGSCSLMRWLREQGCRLPEHELWSTAAACGDVMLDLLHEWGCPQPTRPPSVAAMWAASASAGDLRTLDWLQRHRTGRAALHALTFKYCIKRLAPLEVLQRLVRGGCPVHWDTALAAAQSRNDAVRRWVEEQLLLAGGRIKAPKKAKKRRRRQD